MFECNDENVRRPNGFRAGEKGRAHSLGHDLMRVDHSSHKLKRSSENYSSDDEQGCDFIAAEKKQRFQQVSPEVQQNPRVKVLREKVRVNQSVSNIQDISEDEPAGACINKAARARRKIRSENKESQIPKLLRNVPKDEPMEIQTHVETRQKREIPDGIKNIDERVCQLYCSDYAQGIMEYLQIISHYMFIFAIENDTRIYVETSQRYIPTMKDATIPRSDDYISRGEITAKMRGILVDWLGQVQTYERLSSESLHLCVYMIDRYLTLKLIPLCQLQLLGVACILIATKVIERFPPGIAQLCSLTDSAYVPNEVLHMEREVLRRIKFTLNIPGPIVFLDRYLQIHKHEEQIENVCLYMIDLCLTNTHFVAYPSSKLAAGSLYVARFLFHDGPVWCPALTFYTKYAVDDLLPCARLFAMILSKAEDSMFQSARKKFNTKDFGFISVDPTLNRCRMLMTDFGDD